jgi:hypothetical protein
MAPTIRGVAGERFFSMVEDLPLMPGLTEIVEAGLMFDNPRGRIVTMFAKGNVARPAVLDYYRGALPQLGWEASGSDRFRREGEILRLEFTKETAGLIVRFALSPR